jgi:small basic protein (TIGR04137 family)
MSIHRSLKIKEGLLRQRNVWRRIERIEALKKAGKHADGSSVFGLPKVRTAYKQKKKKVEPAATDATTPASTPTT